VFALSGLGGGNDVSRVKKGAIEQKSLRNTGLNGQITTAELYLWRQNTRTFLCFD